jgi:molybdopterin-guanine dinucleotide biosynthesis protein A
VQVGGIVLCGGKSSRMGLPKATLPFGPEMMLQRVLRLLGEVVHPLVVVAAPTQDLPDLPAGTIVARDQREGRGPLEGLLAGLMAMADQADAAFVTSCDVPLLKPEFVSRMIELLGDHQICVPTEEKFHHPLGAIYRVNVVSVIEELLSADQMRPVFLFDRVETRRVPVEQLREVDPQLSTLMNLNSPDDYLKALNQAGYEAQQSIVNQLQN